MSRLIIFNKPYKVLTQFRTEDDRKTLQDFIAIKNIYPAGRLDYDSEGLLLLTDDGQLQHLISNPQHKMTKTYWVQVEGQINATAIAHLSRGVQLKDGKTKPAQVQLITQPDLWSRNPPIRYRAHIPTSWIQITIKEGRNRQVRRMTAAVGFPTLRLIRIAIGPWQLNNLLPGQWREEEVNRTQLRDFK